MYTAFAATGFRGVFGVFGALAGFFFSAQFAALDFAVGTPVPFVTSNGLGITIY